MVYNFIINTGKITGKVVVGACGTVIATLAGRLIQQNSRHNKAKKQWQDKEYDLQGEISKYQSQLNERENKITEILRELEKVKKNRDELVKELHEEDKMIEIINRRHQELLGMKNKIEGYGKSLLPVENLDKNYFLLIEKDMVKMDLELKDIVKDIGNLNATV